MQSGSDATEHPQCQVTNSAFSRHRTDLNRFVRPPKSFFILLFICCVCL
nr:MAG TPA: hypothetical protein [Caudoviricetes sp.]